MSGTIESIADTIIAAINYSLDNIYRAYQDGTLIVERSLGVPVAAGSVYPSLIGTPTRYTIDAQIVNSTGQSFTTNIWVGANLGGQLYIKNSNGTWAAFDGVNYPVYLSNVTVPDPALGVTVVQSSDNIDLNQYVGGHVYVAYGDDSNVWNYKDIYTIVAH